MIYLKNGIKVIEGPQFQHMWVSISNFGLELDHKTINGLSHLMEHILINPDPENFIFNGYTTRNGMVFWCKSKNNIPAYDAAYELVSWFFHTDGRLKTDVIERDIENYFSELEHEWYYRTNNFNMADPVYVLQGMEKVMCGRKHDFDGNTEYIRRIIRKRLLELSAEQITIMCSHIDESIVELLNETFGSLSSRPRTYDYPPLYIPEQTSPDQNVFLVGGSQQAYQLFIRVPNEEYVINSLISINLYKSNIDLRFISGEPWCVLAYKKEADVIRVLKNLKKGILSPVYITKVFRAPSNPDPIALLYTLHPSVKWDAITHSDLSKFDFGVLERVLSSSVQIYGNTFIQIPNMGNMSITSDPRKPNAWPAYIDTQTYNPELTILHRGPFKFDDTLNVLGETPVFNCQLGLCRGQKKTTEPHRYMLFHQSLFNQLASTFQLIGQTGVRYIIHKGYILITLDALEYIQSHANDSYITSNLFKILCEYYLRTGKQFDKILKAIPLDELPEYTEVPSISNIVAIPKIAPVRGNTTKLIVTPFNFVCGLFNINPTPTQIDQLLWGLKKQGGLYEMYWSKQEEGLYIFCHTTKQFTSESQIRLLIKKLFNYDDGVTIISVSGDGIDLTSLQT